MAFSWVIHFSLQRLVIDITSGVRNEKDSLDSSFEKELLRVCVCDLGMSLIYVVSSSQ